MDHLALWQKGRNQAALERDLRNNRCYVFLKSLSLTSSSFELKVPNLKAVSQETKSCQLYLSSTCEPKDLTRCFACAAVPSLYDSLGWGYQIPEVRVACLPTVVELSNHDTVDRAQHLRPCQLAVPAVQ